MSKSLRIFSAFIMSALGLSLITVGMLFGTANLSSFQTNNVLLTITIIWSAIAFITILFWSIKDLRYRYEAKENELRLEEMEKTLDLDKRNWQVILTKENKKLADRTEQLTSLLENKYAELLEYIDIGTMNTTVHGIEKFVAIKHSQEISNLQAIGPYVCFKIDDVQYRTKISDTDTLIAEVKKNHSKISVNKDGIISVMKTFS